MISDDHKDDGNGGGEGAIYADEDDEIIEVKEQTNINIVVSITIMER